MRKKILLRLRHLALLWLSCQMLCGTALADGSLIPGGEPVGIQLTVDGVLVAGTCEVQTDQGTAWPCRDAGIQAGDVIVSVNGQPVRSGAELVTQMMTMADNVVDMEVMRNGVSRRFTVQAALGADGQWRLGLWLRDGVSGIGTVTYIDPETGAFGALGHGVNDVDSGALLPVEGGSVCQAQIVDVTPGRAGAPGELAGSLQAEYPLGQIDSNTSCGIFGILGQQYLPGQQALPVAEAGQVQSGPATILACVSGGAVQEYEVEITKTAVGASDGRDLLVHVTDPTLLAITGGIVQGMSGSPILQNGQLVGAVTHVLVNDPTRGYGIFIEHMLQAAEAA